MISIIFAAHACQPEEGNAALHGHKQSHFPYPVFMYKGVFLGGFFGGGSEMLRKSEVCCFCTTPPWGGTACFGFICMDCLPLLDSSWIEIAGIHLEYTQEYTGIHPEYTRITPEYTWNTPQGILPEYCLEYFRNVITLQSAVCCQQQGAPTSVVMLCSPTAYSLLHHIITAPSQSTNCTQPSCNT